MSINNYNDRRYVPDHLPKQDIRPDGRFFNALEHGGVPSIKGMYEKREKEHRKRALFSSIYTDGAVFKTTYSDIVTHPLSLVASLKYVGDEDYVDPIEKDGVGKPTVQLVFDKEKDHDGWLGWQLNFAHRTNTHTTHSQFHYYATDYGVGYVTERRYDSQGKLIEHIPYEIDTALHAYATLRTILYHHVVAEQLTIQRRQSVRSKDKYFESVSKKPMWEPYLAGETKRLAGLRDDMSLKPYIRSQ